MLGKTFTLILLFLLCAAPVVAAAGQANVFIYHRFNDTRYPSTNISTQDFRAHLQTLADEDYAVLSLGQVVEALQQGNKLPERCAVITVDDAYKSFMTEAWPVLKSFGFPATLFVNTDQVKGGDFLGWDELKRLQREGVELGNHSASHLYMLDRFAEETPQEWQDRVVNDIMRAQDAFVEHLGAAPDLFAYPYGEYSDALARLVEELGFRAAVGQQSGVIAHGQDMFKLPRFPMGGGLADFRQKLRMRHLPVQPQGAQDTVINSENPPEFKFSLNYDKVALDTLQCYASDGLECDLDVLPGEESFVAEASGPLTGRRGKYTITASDSSGRQWYWYSHLWVLARRPVTDYPVAGRE